MRGRRRLLEDGSDARRNRVIVYLSDAELEELDRRVAARAGWSRSDELRERAGLGKAARRRSQERCASHP